MVNGNNSIPYRMKKTQAAFLATVESVLGVLAEYAAKLASVGAMVAVRDQIQEKLGRIKTLSEAQSRCQTGVTAKKDGLRELLTARLVTLCGQLRAWAQQTKQPDIEQRVPASKTSWTRLPQARVEEQATALLELAKENQSKLTEYGVTADSLQQLQEEIASFAAEVSGPRAARTHRKTLTSTLEQEVRELAELLDKVLDPLMHQFEATEPKFFADYWNARAVDQPSSTSIVTIRERAAAKAAQAKARKEAKAARIAAKAAAESEARAQVKARLEAIANGTSASGSNGRATVAQLRETVVAEVPAAALPN